MAVPVVAGAAACVFYRRPIMDLLYSSHAAESAPIFALLISGFVAISMVYIYGTLLTANGSLRQLNIVAFCGIVFNIAMNFVLIPRYGALGAAIVSLATQSLTAFAQIAIAFSIFGLKFRGRTQFMLLLYVLGIAAFGFASTNLPFGWYGNALIMFAVSGLWAFALRLVRINDFLTLVKTKSE